MANVKLVLLPVNITNYLIIRVERVDDLGVEITRQAFAQPHTQRNISFVNLEPVMYRFFFWESLDGLALTTNLGSADIDASLAFEAMIEIFEFIVDRGQPNDPVSGQNQYRNPDLLDCIHLVPAAVIPAAGAYTVEQRAVGKKLSTEITDVPNPGGFDLSTDIFYAGDIWVVVKYSKIVAQTVPTAGDYPRDIVTETDPVVVLNDTHYSKEIEAAGNAETQIFQFPDLGGVADKRYWLFNTHKFTGNYVVLDFSNGGSMIYQGEEVSVFYMPKGEEIAIMVKAHKGRIVFYPGNAARRGQIIPDYKADRVGYIPAIGTEYTKAQMPGLYEFVENLPAGVAQTFADWNSDPGGLGKFPYKRCWAIDVGTEKIKVPDLRDTSIKFLKMAADPNRIPNQPGGLQMDAVGPIDNATIELQNGAGGDNTNPLNWNGAPRGFSGMDNQAGWINNKIGGVAQWIRFSGGGTETSVRTAGLIPLITL
jgi:hypothetical protein